MARTAEDYRNGDERGPAQVAGPQAETSVDSFTPAEVDDPFLDEDEGLESLPTQREDAPGSLPAPSGPFLDATGMLLAIGAYLRLIGKPNHHLPTGKMDNGRMWYAYPDFANRVVKVTRKDMAFTDKPVIFERTYKPEFFLSFE